MTLSKHRFTNAVTNVTTFRLFCYQSTEQSYGNTESICFILKKENVSNGGVIYASVFHQIICKNQSKWVLINQSDTKSFWISDAFYFDATVPVGAPRDLDVRITSPNSAYATWTGVPDKRETARGKLLGYKVSTFIHLFFHFKLILCSICLFQFILFCFSWQA